MTDLRGGPYKFDFLETIVGINFDSGGYILLEVNASKAVQGSASPPPYPTITLSLGEGQTQIDTRESGFKTSTPGSTTISNRYYIWNPMAEFPTSATFDSPIGFDPPIAYGHQLAKVVNMGSGYLAITSYGVPEGAGIWGTFAEAQAYADLWNARFAGGVGGFDYPQRMFNNVMGTVTQVGPAAPVVNVYTITTTVTTEPSASASVTKYFLVKVPRRLTSLTVNVSGASGEAQINVKGYHGRVPPKVVNVNPAGFDTVANGATPNPVTSRVDKVGAQDFTTVTASGGGYGGPG